jgi:hypothetical protein
VSATGSLGGYEPSEHGGGASWGRSTRSKACYSSVAIGKNEAQMLRGLGSIDENPNPSMTPAE